MTQTDEDITVTADSFEVYAMLDVPYLLDDNCFVIKKGETKTLKKLRSL